MPVIFLLHVWVFSSPPPLHPLFFFLFLKKKYKGHLGIWTCRNLWHALTNVWTGRPRDQDSAFHCSEPQQVSLDNIFFFSTAHFITTQEEFDHSSSSTFCPRLCPTGNPTGGKGEKGAMRKTHLTHIWLHFPRRKAIWKSSSRKSIIS